MKSGADYLYIWLSIRPILHLSVAAQTHLQASSSLVLGTSKELASFPSSPLFELENPQSPHSDQKHP